ncbi:hypothetical protein Kyoto142A_09150 [Helicobacter pylori]
MLEEIRSHRQKRAGFAKQAFKSAIEDLKRQNRKLEEENIVLKERVDGLKEQFSKLQQQKPQ